MACSGSQTASRFLPSESISCPWPRFQSWMVLDHGFSPALFLFFKPEVAGIAAANCYNNTFLHSFGINRFAYEEFNQAVVPLRAEHDSVEMGISSSASPALHVFLLAGMEWLPSSAWLGVHDRKEKRKYESNTICGEQLIFQRFPLLLLENRFGIKRQSLLCQTNG